GTGRLTGCCGCAGTGRCAEARRSAGADAGLGSDRDRGPAVVLGHGSTDVENVPAGPLQLGADRHQSGGPAGPRWPADEPGVACFERPANPAAVVTAPTEEHRLVPGRCGP